MPAAGASGGEPVRRRYYADDWGKEAVTRLSAWWRDRLGLDDRSAVGTRRIEIGRGSSPQPGYLHVDVNPWAPHVEVVANAWQLPFSDDWADEIGRGGPHPCAQRAATDGAIRTEHDRGEMGAQRGSTRDVLQRRHQPAGRDRVAR